MRFQLISTLVYASLLLPLSLFAELVFENESLAIDAGWSDERVQASFAFVNSGAAAVEILSVRASCGCTAAEPTQRLYEPGESGKIETVFDIGNRQGMQQHSILVATSSGDHSLRLAVDIPVTWQIDNRVLVWRDHEKDEVKHARIQISDPRVVSVGLADPDGDHWEVELSGQDDDWLLSAVPVTYKSRQSQSLQLLLQREDGSEAKISLLLRML